jgi:tetratricopeptide (TPR) repeat protein
MHTLNKANFASSTGQRNQTVKKAIALLLGLILSIVIFQRANSQNNLDNALCQAVDYALDFEYPKALALLDSLRLEDPEDVRPYLFKAVVYIQFLVNCRNVERNRILFFQNIDEAEKIAKRMAEEDENSWQANFLLGGVYGWKAKYYLDAGSKWETFINARRAKGYFERTQKLDPDCFDVYYGLGIYHYYAGTLPRLLRFFLPLLNFEGDTRRGIRELNLAKEKGTYSRDFAAYELVLIYLDKEEKREEGLQLVLKLCEKYPQNFNFQLLRGQYYHYLGEDSLAESTIERLKSEIQDDFYARLSNDKRAECQLWSGLVHLSLNQDEEAQNDFETALSMCESDALRSQAHYLFGLALNERGRYDQAYQHYLESLEHKDSFGSHYKAKEEITRLKKGKLIRKY